MALDLHLLGGCGSSGTTLVAHVLDGLAGVRSGPELGAFHHRELYGSGDFRRALYRCFAGQAAGKDVDVEGLRYALVPSVFLMERGFYGLEGVDAEYDLLFAGEDLVSFFEALKARFAAAQGIAAPFTWVDQTPKNAVCALEFLRGVPGSRFVHVVRDGRDVAASLARRYAREAPGHREDTYLTVALARWTWDVTQALRARHEPGYLELRYEDFVRDPLTHTNRVLEHLRRPPVDRGTFEARRSPSAEAAAERMQGGEKPTWTRSPDQPITDAAVGRWREALSSELLEAAMAFEFVPPGEARSLSFARLLDELDYPA